MRYLRLFFVALVVGVILSGETEKAQPVTVPTNYYSQMSLEETDGNGYVPIPPQQEWRSFIHQRTGTWRADCR